jgi:outer membrane immunogenic protein
LIYATGGIAFGKVHARVADALIPATFSDSRVRMGFTLGAGVEYAFAENLTGRVEYLYTIYRNKNMFAFPYLTSSTYQTSVLRGGVNYRF